MRPELLELVPDEDGSGEVVAREFRGHDIFYRVRLEDGTTVCSQRPSTEDVPLGAPRRRPPRTTGASRCSTPFDGTPRASN